MRSVLSAPSEAGQPAAEVGQQRTALEDVALVRLVHEGDAPALEALYHRYGRACFSLARRILTDVTLAQDVVQEVFLSLWKDAGRFDVSRGGFATWLLSMTHHKAVDVVRREENLRKRRNAADAAEAVRVPLPGPDDEAWATLRRERVRGALAVLPTAQREALGLAYYGGYTQREIAGLTDTPLGTVKTRMLAGMRKMREALEGALDEDERDQL
ncbi:MAG TPA: sigma-70 family RNA polymerase sigma factor [Mycobacteriales bacterium]|nr:sigma-70 family RNA polymerase sigma factor [Mycobacteriales bacterium]